AGASDRRPGAGKNTGAPAMIQRVDAAPSGNRLHVTLLQKPFSYTVQVSSFGNLEQIWDVTGKAVIDLSKRPLRETDMNDDDPDAAAARAASDTAKRNIEWLPGTDAIYFLQSDAPASPVSPALPPAPAEEGQPRAG